MPWGSSTAQNSPGSSRSSSSLPSARRAHEDRVQLFEQRLVGMVQRHLDAQRLRQLQLHVLERDDLRDRQLGRGVFFAAQRTCNQHRHINLQLLGELLVALREGDQLDLADGVFERGLRVEFAGALRLGHLQAGDDAGDGDLVLRLLIAATAEDLRLGLHLDRLRGGDDLHIT